MEKQKVSVSSDEIEIPIEELEKGVMHLHAPKYCIYQIPEMLREGNKDAYTPHLISIGPMHYDILKFKPELKILYRYYFCERLKKETRREKVLECFTNYLKRSEEEIRKCYSEKYHMETDEFVRMILLDAIFIVELFMRKAEKKVDNKNHENDYIFKKAWLYKEIERDLSLAENQLPFFVLEELYKDLTKRGNFLELACSFFEAYIPEKSAGKLNDLLKHGWDMPRHFTDLIRSFHIPQDSVLERDQRKENWVVMNAIKLKSAGICFEPVRDTCLLDVKFKKAKFLNCLSCLCCLPYLNSVKARLLFPKLTVYDSTEYVLRNLMAFEQCHYPDDNYICSYVCLIDMLIGDKNDAAVLVESGVIANNLSSEEELTTLINNLCKNVVINSHCFGGVSKKLNEHYKNPWNKTLAELRLVYFASPWIGTGTVVGLVVLLLTIGSFILSYIEYFKDLYEYAISGLGCFSCNL